MVNTLCFTPVCSLVSPNKPGVILGDSVAGKVLRVGKIFQSSKSSKFQSLEAKAAGGNKGTKPNSIVCADCDGNDLLMLIPVKGRGFICWSLLRIVDQQCDISDEFLDLIRAFNVLTYLRVLKYVPNAKELVSILWTTSMDSSKLVDYAGSAEVKGIFSVEVATELAFSVDS
ncbi:hypothetical protein JCGZ_13327 [Jatropha curcas]|uniref:Uncharacterized protein n=1 Tax=Jatropha curcas TaxID=180498 RepID=A0A067K8G9_JATCU|nr:hypothetical protein JCGZ_13327 [Jatropha curcas]